MARTKQTNKKPNEESSVTVKAGKKAAKKAAAPKSLARTRGAKKDQEEIAANDQDSQPEGVPSTKLTVETQKPAQSPQEEEKVPQIRALRTYFANRLQEKLDKSWRFPEKKVFEGIQDISVTISKKNLKTKAEHGVKINCKDETASFEVLTSAPESFQALAQSYCAYMDAYKEWRKLDKNLESKLFEPIVVLTVYDENQIKPILDQMKKNGQTVDKIKVINPKDENDLKELKGEEIAKFTQESQSAPKQKNG